MSRAQIVALLEATAGADRLGNGMTEDTGTHVELIRNHQKEASVSIGLISLEHCSFHRNKFDQFLPDSDHWEDLYDFTTISCYDGSSARIDSDQFYKSIHAPY